MKDSLRLYYLGDIGFSPGAAAASQATLIIYQAFGGALPDTTSSVASVSLRS